MTTYFDYRARQTGTAQLPQVMFDAPDPGIALRIRDAITEARCESFMREMVRAEAGASEIHVIEHALPESQPRLVSVR